MEKMKYILIKYGWILGVGVIGGAVAWYYLGGGDNTNQLVNTINCNRRVPVESELYGAYEEWPLAVKKYPGHQLTSLDTLFASMDCGEEYVQKNFAEAKYQVGAMTLSYYDSASPSEFRSILNTAGFILTKSGPTYSYDGSIDQKYVESWELHKSIDIDLVKPLRQFANLPWSSVWAGWADE